MTDFSTTDPFVTRHEWDYQRNCPVLTFQDKNYPIIISYPVPEFYKNDRRCEDYTYNYNVAVESVLRLQFLHNRNLIIESLRNEKAPEGALVDAIVQDEPA